MPESESPAPTQETPVVTPTDTNKPAAPAAQVVTLTADAYQKQWQELVELRSYKSTAENETKAKLDEARRGDLVKLAEAQGAKAALEAQEAALRRDYEAEVQARKTIEGDWLTEKRENVISNAIGNRKFASDDAKEQVLTLLGARFEAKREDGKVVVRDKATGRLASEVIPDWLDSASGSHFLAASSKGGSGAKGGDKPTPTEEPDVDPVIAHERKRLGYSGNGPRQSGIR